MFNNNVELRRRNGCYSGKPNKSMTAWNSKMLCLKAMYTLNLHRWQQFLFLFLMTMLTILCFRNA